VVEYMLSIYEVQVWSPAHKQNNYGSHAHLA
jgi:hypothetical protein